MSELENQAREGRQEKRYKHAGASDSGSSRGGSIDSQAGEEGEGADLRRNGAGDIFIAREVTDDAGKRTNGRMA